MSLKLMKLMKLMLKCLHNNVDENQQENENKESQHEPPRKYVNLSGGIGAFLVRLI